MKIRQMIVDCDEFDVDDECLGLAKMMKIHLHPITWKNFIEYTSYTSAHILDIEIPKYPML